MMINKTADRMLPPSKPLAEIDPMIAWEPWHASDQEPWDRRRVCLLFRRGAFGANEQQITDALRQEPNVVVRGILQPDEIDKKRKIFESESSVLSSAMRATGEVNQLATWWLHRMLNSPEPIVERMTLFWHGHFATGAEKVQDIELMYGQNQLLRKYALGDFRKLVHEISKDPAMLIYLDSVTNRKAHANENYARELMELFCLGEGNYTEADVQQLARCFTGWEIRRKQFRFNPYQHDDAKKTLLGRSDIESGESAIDVVLASMHMPKFIVSKLFKFFVCDEPEPPPSLLEPLERVFVQSQYSTQSVVSTILESRIMLSGWSIGRKVRSPVELAVELLRSLQGSTNIGMLSDRLKYLGQSLFYPPNVKGWAGGRSWINSSTLIGRANMVYDIVRNENTRFNGETIGVFAKSNHLNDSDKLLNWLESNLLVNTLTPAERDSILSKVSELDSEQMAKQTIIELASLPRIHLS